eukprot:scaffold5115_cov76-Amphora_coffeaeformis.AAC.1
MFVPSMPPPNISIQSSSSAVANALRVLSIQKSLPTFPPKEQQQPKFPVRCPSPTHGEGCDTVSNSSFEAPPRRPGRCPSPLNVEAPIPMAMTMMQQQLPQGSPNASFQLGMAPRRPVRRSSFAMDNA